MSVEILFQLIFAFVTPQLAAQFAIAVVTAAGGCYGAYVSAQAGIRVAIAKVEVRIDGCDRQIVDVKEATRREIDDIRQGVRRLEDFQMKRA